MPDGRTGTVVGVNQEARTADVEVIGPDGRIEIVTTPLRTLALASQREEPAD